MGSPKPLVRRKVGSIFPRVHVGQKAAFTLNCCRIWFSDTRKEGPSLLLVLKWGGELTPAGRVQAEELGRAFRCMYPGGQGETRTQLKTVVYYFTL